MIVAAALFEWAAWALNPLCFALSPVALAGRHAVQLRQALHLVVRTSGSAWASRSPVRRATSPSRAQWSEPGWLLWALAAAVTFWVGGFDIFYALPDEQFDRGEGLAAAVVRFGQARGILLAKLLHGLTLAALLAVRLGRGLGWATTPAWRSARRSSPTSTGSCSRATCPGSTRRSSR